jgi:hypothetical protein
MESCRVVKDGLCISHLLFVGVIKYYVESSIKSYRCYFGMFKEVLRLIWSKKLVFSKPRFSSPKTLINRYLTQSAVEMVLYWYLTSKDIAERVQSNLSAWKNQQFFCSWKSRSLYVCSPYRHLISPRSVCEAIDKVRPSFVWGIQ